MGVERDSAGISKEKASVGRSLTRCERGGRGGAMLLPLGFNKSYIPNTEEKRGGNMYS